ncbi:MAG: alanine racemase [Alphaproteobacteria bacterium]
MSAADRAGAVLTIDLAALAANYRLLAGMAPGAECGAAVKADAYGIGMAEAAPALAAAGCRHFFVALIDEGLALRPILPEAEIYVLNGPLAGTENDFTAHRLVPVLNSLGQLELWQRHAGKRGGSRAVLHIDTGMNRLGLPAAEVDRLAAAPERYLNGISLDYVMSHLASADTPGSAQNADQLAAFASARTKLPNAKASFANSSGIFLGSAYHFDLVRPGAALYGVSPTDRSHANPMRPVVSLQGRILQVRDVDSPMTVGYGAAYAVRERGKLATISVGYADGFLRTLGNRGHVSIGGHRRPIVGRVSMDLITVDVTGVPAPLIEPGGFVDLIGATLTVDDLADAAGTIGYEILTSLGRRYHRRHVGQQPDSGRFPA